MENGVESAERDGGSPKEAEDIDREEELKNTDRDKDKDKEERGLPLARVKRIVGLDKELKPVPRKVLVAITHAAQLFMESFASEAFAEMLKAKRKSLRLEHLEAAVRRKRAFLNFLDDSMEIFASKKDVGSDIEGEDEDEGEEEEPKDKKHAALPPGTRCITDFFGGKSTRVTGKSTALEEEEATELAGSSH